jgi:hypothetical protein
LARWLLLSISVSFAACAASEPARAPAPRAASPGVRALAPAPVAPPVASAAPSAAPAPEAPPPTRFLKGQTHVHTARSYDAHTPPEEVLRFYQQHGYDFVAITDHNRVTVVDPPEGLLLVPGVELSQNSTICEPKPTPGYRCLFHTSGLFVDPLKDSAKGERISMAFRPVRSAAYQQQLNIVARLGGVPVINHPLFHFAANARLIESLATHGVELVELWNASLDRQNPKGRETAERHGEELWDQILSSGTKVFAVATDDAHHFSDAAERRRMGKFAYTGDRAWIMVRAQKNLTAIRDALLAGDFYATTGVTLSRLATSAEHIELRAEPRAGASYRIRFVGKGGRELRSVAGEAASYRPSGDEGYVRAVVEADSGEKAWIQPVWPGSG